jgi:alcohol dehydrogenase class IV
MTHIGSRFIQAGMRVVARLIRIPEPTLYSGHKMSHKVIDILQYHQKKQVLIVTDHGLMSLKLLDPLMNLLKQQQMIYHVYSDTQVNPTITNLEEAKTLYYRHHCDAIIGFGGGSSLDCAKGAAALVASQKSVRQLKGLLKVRRHPPLMIMIPTTAGTGSEATVAVVVSNPKTKEKYAISDPVLVPKYAILDSALTLGLPAPLTAQTGMDAFTHAVEAFLGRSNTPYTIKKAKLSLTLIHQHLLKSFYHPEDEVARRGMLEAAYHAGLAFTRAYVGYVHGIAHTLGGFYQCPHGLANAVILPYVLDAYGRTIHSKLAIISDWLHLTDLNAPVLLKVKAFKEYLKTLNQQLGIPTTLPNLIRPEDIPAMMKRVSQEVYPLYPVPTFLSNETIRDLYLTIGGLPT